MTVFVVIMVCTHAYTSSAVSAEEDDEPIQIPAEKLKEVMPDWRGLRLELRVPLVGLDHLKSKPDRDPLQKKFGYAIILD